MENLTTLAGALSSYGLYTIIACLVIAVIYLFKQVADLNSRIQTLLLEQAKSSTELTGRVLVALEQSTKAIEKIDNFLSK